jgi:hypothetical protein
MLVEIHEPGLMLISTGLLIVPLHETTVFIPQIYLSVLRFSIGTCHV